MQVAWRERRKLLLEQQDAGWQRGCTGDGAEPSQSDMNDRRRHTRNKFHAPVMVWSIASGPLNAVRGDCVNLTEAGAGAMISGPWAPGQVVNMEIAVPGSQAVTVQARLSHRNHHACGFEFLGTDPRVMHQLRSVCAVGCEA